LEYKFYTKSRIGFTPAVPVTPPTSISEAPPLPTKIERLNTDDPRRGLVGAIGKTVGAPPIESYQQPINPMLAGPNRSIHDVEGRQNLAVSVPPTWTAADGAAQQLLGVTGVIATSARRCSICRSKQWSTSIPQMPT